MPFNLGGITSRRTNITAASRESHPRNSPRHRPSNRVVLIPAAPEFCVDSPRQNSPEWRDAQRKLEPTAQAPSTTVGRMGRVSGVVSVADEMRVPVSRRSAAAIAGLHSDVVEEDPDVESCRRLVRT